MNNDLYPDAVLLFQFESLHIYITYIIKNRIFTTIYPPTQWWIMNNNNNNNNNCKRSKMMTNIQSQIIKMIAVLLDYYFVFVLPTIVGHERAFDLESEGIASPDDTA
jgi:hypothetical protein